jgi:hypothetical protein
MRFVGEANIIHPLLNYLLQIIQETYTLFQGLRNSNTGPNINL